MSEGTTSTASDSKKTATSSNRRTIDTEGVKSPLPTPDSENLPTSSSQITLHPPPTPDEISSQLAKICEEQNNRDHELDAADLRALMQEALATSSDAEMLRVLQVTREDFPEALKTLQRALEREREREEQELDKAEGRSSEDADAGTEANEEQVIEFSPAGNKAGQGAGALRLTGLARRLTLDSVVTRSSRKSKSSKRNSRWSAKNRSDTLDREFIETGIDALRRLSSGQELNLPNWTITRYA
jgi:abelson tyrosine-protein kinase 1